MTEPRVALLVRVPASLKSRLAEMANHERRSVRKQVELLLERCLELEGRKGTTMPAKSGRRGGQLIYGLQMPRFAFYSALGLDHNPTPRCAGSSQLFMSAATLVSGQSWKGTIRTGRDVVLLTSAIRWQSTRIASWLSNANVSRQFPLTRTAPSKSHLSGCRTCPAHSV